MSSSQSVTNFSYSYTSAAASTIVIGLLLWWLLDFPLDPEEPPFLKPKFPVIGHNIGIFTYHSAYYNRLFAKTPWPIFTIRLFTARGYVITSPALIQSAFRSKNLSFEPYMVDLAQCMLGISDERMEPILRDGTPERPAFIGQLINAIHGSMAPHNVQQMNKEALNEVAAELNSLGGVFEPESCYLWVRKFLTVATCNALLGSHNPTRKNPGLIDSLWDFEGGFLAFALNIFPQFFAPKGIKGRAEFQKALIEYYTKEYDLAPDVAEMTRARAEVYRRNGFPPEEIGNFELAHIYVSTTNAIPTTFWNLVFVFADPEVLSTIREEVLTIITEEKEKNEAGKRVISIDITKFDNNCPVLISAYRETVRLVNSHIGFRRVLADTTITDGKNSYLLKEGADVIMPAGVTHLSPVTWGSDSLTFEARRFIPFNTFQLTEKEKSLEKEKKAAYIPFGGGKNLCPGRNFAFAEILGTIAILALGWEIKGTDGGLLKVPKLGRAMLGEGVVKPRGEGVKMGARIERREGWEDAVFKFIVV